MAIFYEIIAVMQLKDTNRLTLLLSLSLSVAILSGSIVLFLTTATSPRDIGGLGVTAWFIGLFALSSTSLTLVRYLISTGRTTSDKKLALYRHCLRSSLVIGLFISVSLAMQSLRMLNLGDILLFLMTIAIIELYFRTKRK